MPVLKKKTKAALGAASEITNSLNDIESTTNINDFIFNPNSDISTEEIILSVQGKNIGSSGNVVIITGKPKSRKSVVAHAIIGAGLSHKSVLGIECNLPNKLDQIILVDTEQSKHDLKRSLHRMQKMIGLEDLPENFTCYTTRQLDPDKIKKLLLEVVKNKNVKLIIIDGGLDLINNMNDVIETKQTIDFIKNFLDLNNICMVLIVHQSKTTNFTIGHFGSFLDRFAQSNIEVKKLDNGNSEISAQLMRSDENFKPYEFYFNYNDDNYSINWTENLEVTAKNVFDWTEDEHKNKIEKLFFTKEIVSYTVCVKFLILEYKKSESFCKKLMKHFFDKNILENTDEGIKIFKLPF